jgi:hypothetical protein
MGSKTLSLPDNQQKRPEFLGFYGVICALNEILTIFVNCTLLLFIFVRFIKKIHPIPFVAGRTF